MVFLALAFAGLVPAAETNILGVRGEHHCGPGDRLTVTVFEVEELSGPVAIDGDGLIRLPLIGAVLAGGLTTGQIEARLAEIDQVFAATDFPGLSVVASGKPVRAASDLLYSPRLQSPLDQAAERFEHVVIDSPPSLALSDARTIGRNVDSLVLVVSDKTDRNALLRTKQSFDDAGIGFLGFVMNRISLGNLDYGYYRDYGYSYASHADEHKGDGASARSS